ncbi:hypothetical protein BDY24DRAFT_381321 [Mrakia frigida]|uniref:lysophospholipid acyltransferase family protein n=1 Tax=Mrakia frigida TaxID=29902 RepID=UPI003FCBFF88
MLPLLGQISATIQVACLWTFCNFGLATRLFFEPFSPTLAWDATSTFAWVLWNWMQRMFEVSHGGEEALTWSGDEIPEGESGIVIANHQSFNDYLFVQGLAVRAGMLSRCRYFAKRQLVWQIPLFGLGFWLIGFLLIDRNWAEDEKKIDSTFRRIKKNKSPIWIVTYLEGTRRTPKGIAASQAFCEKAGKPVLSEVLFPRTKGFVATVQGLRNSHVKAVYDLTIAISSPEGFQVPFLPMTLYGISDLTKAGYKFHVHVRRTLISSLPDDPKEVAAWAENAWVEKDKVLKAMRKEWTDAEVLKEGSMGGVRRWKWFGPLLSKGGSSKKTQ